MRLGEGAGVHSMPEPSVQNSDKWIELPAVTSADVWEENKGQTNISVVDRPKENGSAAKTFLLCDALSAQI